MKQETRDDGDKKQGLRVKVTEAEYVDGEFKVLKVIPEGKKEMAWEEWERSARMGESYANEGVASHE